MPSADSRPPLLALVGPTAVGKSEVAIDLAEHFNGEIVSADSRLLYRGMDIGTAKPSLEQRSRVIHHLIDVADPDEIWSLALFQREAEKAIASIYSRGNLPILVGGTGQYVRAILEGWSPPALVAQPALRAALETWAAEIGKDGLHARLARLDPQAAASIDARNQRRTLRALEVTLSSGRKFSAQRTRKESPYRLLQIGLTRPRPELYRRIDARIDSMLATGWLDEERALLAKGYDPNLPCMSAIGYAQLSQHLQGNLSLEEAVVEIKRQTRIFVRRQANWFKPSDPNIHWIDLQRKEALETIDNLLNNFLKTAVIDSP
jgi:tRNA dimethylallyltransferase